MFTSVFYCHVDWILQAGPSPGPAADAPIVP